MQVVLFLNEPTDFPFCVIFNHLNVNYSHPYCLDQNNFQIAAGLRFEIIVVVKALNLHDLCENELVRETESHLKGYGCSSI